MSTFPNYGADESAQQMSEQMGYDWGKVDAAEVLAELELLYLVEHHQVQTRQGET